MAKKLVSLLLALTLAVVCGAALAETTTTGVAYGVYSNEGEHPDSLIRVTLTLDNGAITAAELDEKLIPVAMGGAASWAELTDETAALLGDAVIEAYLVANGVDYDLTTAAQDESGVWTVADTTTGATLAGTTNYLRIAQEAYANAQ